MCASIQLKERIGEGSFGVVHRAIDSNKEIIVKIIDNIKDAEALHNNISALTKCTHANIASYYGTCIKGDEFWIMTEYCGLGSVKDITQTLRRPLKEKEIACICRYILEGLRYLHQLDPPVVHSNIKSTNILINEKGDVKLADFGIVQQILATLNLDTTSPFMAPETGTTPCTFQMDVWSLGIAAIEMADGRPPHADSLSNVLSKIRKNPAPTLKDPKQWSQEFNYFIAQCLVKEPSLRASVDELRQLSFITSATPQSMKYLCKELLKAKKLLDSRIKKKGSLYSKSMSVLPLVDNTEKPQKPSSVSADRYESRSLKFDRIKAFLKIPNKSTTTQPINKNLHKSPSVTELSSCSTTTPAVRVAKPIPISFRPRPTSAPPSPRPPMPTTNESESPKDNFASTPSVDAPSPPLSVSAPIKTTFSPSSFEASPSITHYLAAVSQSHLPNDELDISADDIEFIECVGVGGYGEVWKGKWNGRGGGTLVAIKKIEVITTLEFQKEIALEVNILTKLRHPNIVPIFGACFNKHELWIVMELMEGGTLYAKLHSEETIPFEVRLRWAQQAALGVNALHLNNSCILHRDIKSLNFLLSGDGRTLKLIDFGLAKVYSLASPKVSGKPNIGTVRWAAPETLCEHPYWTPKADIYSLGMTFYEIASHKLPFYELDDMRVFFVVIAKKHYPKLPEDCHTGFAKLIYKCLEHEPEQRPSSKELLHILDTLLAPFSPLPSPTRKTSSSRYGSPTTTVTSTSPSLSTHFE